MARENLDKLVLEHFQIDNAPEPDLTRWMSFLDKLNNPKSTVDIALVGKYVELQDAYKSILESFVHAGAANECKVNVHSIHSEYLDKDNVEEKLSSMDGILVAPGFTLQKRAIFLRSSGVSSCSVRHTMISGCTPHL